MEKNIIYTEGYKTQNWEIIGREKVNKNHTLFTLAGPKYENEIGIFRESIKVRDNVITKLRKNIYDIKDVRNRSLDNWCYKDKDTFDIICIKANPEYIKNVIEKEYNLC